MTQKAQTLQSLQLATLTTEVERIISAISEGHCAAALRGQPGERNLAICFQRVALAVCARFKISSRKRRAADSEGKARRGI